MRFDQVIQVGLAPCTHMYGAATDHAKLYSSPCSLPSIKIPLPKDPWLLICISMCSYALFSLPKLTARRVLGLWSPCYSESKACINLQPCLASRALIKQHKLWKPTPLSFLGYIKCPNQSKLYFIYQDLSSVGTYGTTS